jgi:small subunit ribosomal protein S9
LTEVPPEDQRPDQEPQTAEPDAEETASTEDVPVEDAAAEPGEAAEGQAEPAPPADAPAEPEGSAEPEVEVTGSAPQAGEGDVEEEQDDEELLEDKPRERPEIPGADLEPDIVLEGDDSEDGEDGEDGASSEDEDAEDEPIAGAAIDLAAGARYPDKGYVVGKRKSAVARVYLIAGNGDFRITSTEKKVVRDLDGYFPRATLQKTIRHPLEAVGFEGSLDVVARMHGGGVASQADALRHGIARALLEADPNLRGELKRRGFLTRDSRVKERKKAGLKKARKKPQFSKR